MEERLPGVGNEWHRDLSGTEQWIVKEREACASWGHGISWVPRSLLCGERETLGRVTGLGLVGRV